MQKHFYNYIQLIVFDRRVNLKTNNFVYYDSDRLFSKSVYTGKEQGHKIARQIFDYIGMSNSYVLTRGNVLCELLAKNPDQLENDALCIIFITELKWIIDEEQYRKLEELIQLNEDKFSQKLFECIRR